MLTGRQEVGPKGCLGPTACRPAGGGRRPKARALASVHAHFHSLSNTMATLVEQIQELLALPAAEAQRRRHAQARAALPMALLR